MVERQEQYVQKMIECLEEGERRVELAKVGLQSKGLNPCASPPVPDFVGVRVLRMMWDAARDAVTNNWPVDQGVELPADRLGANLQGKNWGTGDKRRTRRAKSESGWLPTVGKSDRAIAAWKA
jgi:hypothetical protein